MLHHSSILGRPAYSPALAKGPYVPADACPEDWLCPIVGGMRDVCGRIFLARSEVLPMTFLEIPHFVPPETEVKAAVARKTRLIK